MSRIDQDGLAAFLVTQITHIPECSRSPELVARLLEEIDLMEWETALSWAMTAGHGLQKPLQELKAHHTADIVRVRIEGTKRFRNHAIVDDQAAEGTWGTTKAMLRDFADQTGGQVLIPVEKALDAVQLVREIAKGR